MSVFSVVGVKGSCDGAAEEDDDGQTWREVSVLLVLSMMECLQ